jgi:hypothetical protein
VVVSDSSIIYLDASNGKVLKTEELGKTFEQFSLASLQGEHA